MASYYGKGVDAVLGFVLEAKGMFYALALEDDSWTLVKKTEHQDEATFYLQMFQEEQLPGLEDHS